MRIHCTSSSRARDTSDGISRSFFLPSRSLRSFSREEKTALLLEEGEDETSDSGWGCFSVGEDDGEEEGEGEVGEKVEGSSKSPKLRSDEEVEDDDDDDGSSSETVSRSDFSLSSSFFCRADSSAATRSAMCNSRVLAREKFVCGSILSRQPWYGQERCSATS